MSGFIETIEDLQLRALPRVRVFSADQQLSSTNANQRLATSSRFGICVLAGNNRKLYSCWLADIHKLGTQQQQQGMEETSAVQFRTIAHHNPAAEIVSIAINADGSVLALALNTPNGPFVDLYDVLAFAPIAEQQPFPLASIRLCSSTEQSAATTSIAQLEWNPVESDTFAALSSNHALCTIKCSLEQMSSSVSPSFTILGQLDTIGATCLCWSPKGKQLTVGDLAGRIHQLKPDLTSVRVIVAPDSIPAFGPEQRFCCTGVCWLSTTEWLVAHRPATPNPAAPSNIGLLVVKKQQPLKWTHFGDVLPTARGAVCFCPMLEWHMVFVYSADCSSVVLFGQRGEHWVRFEFETYDIEMPLAADKRTKTFPLGARLDFSSTAPLYLGDGVQAPSPPFIHFLNSAGCLLPYAAVSLTARPALTKAPEQIQMASARFGRPPPGYIPPQPTLSTAAAQAQQSPASPPLQQQTGDGPDAPPSSFSFSPQQQPSVPSSIGTAKTPPMLQQQQIQQPQPVKATTTIDYAKQQQEEQQRRQQQQQKEAAQKAEEAEQNRKKAQKQMLEEQRASVAELERQLEKAVVEYTGARNAQALQIDTLSAVRAECERAASTLNTEQFAELHNIKCDLSQSFRQAQAQLAKTSAKVQQNVEALNGIRLFAKAKQQQNRGGGAIQLQQKGQRSFDIEKRLELVGQQFESVLDKLEGTKRMLNRLDDQHSFMARAGNEAIDPQEQRRIIQVNDNIAKLCAKLDTRLQRARRAIEGNHKAEMRSAGSKKLPGNTATTSSSQQQVTAIAQFCAMELEQLTLQDSAASDKDRWTMLDGADVEQLADQKKLRDNLNAYLKNLPAGDIPIRRVCPLRTTPATATVAPQQQPPQAVGQFDESDLQLAQRIQRMACSPPKPQLCSIGVQSPDFVAATPKPEKKKTPKKASTKKAPAPSFIPDEPSLSSISSGTPQSTMKTTPASTTKLPAATILPSLPSFAATTTATGPATTDFSLPKPAAPSTTEQPPMPVPSLPSVPTEPKITQQQPVPSVVVSSTTAPATAAPAPIVAAASTICTPTTTTATPPVATTATATISVVDDEPKPVAPPVAAEEGMEDEVVTTTTTATTGTPVTFDFMKSSGSMGLGSSTPINAGRNPFAGPAMANSSSGGSTPFGTPASSFGASPFGTPSRLSTGGGAGFGALGASANVSSSPSSATGSAFGASPFKSAAASPSSASSAFGGGPTFGGGASAFGGGGGGGFGASPFGGGKSMFGGGMAAGGGGSAAASPSSGFSAFASKSGGFGQLASQQQPSSSLFGGGPAAGGAGFGSFGSPSIGGGTGAAVGSSPSSLVQPKTSAFTAFRK